MRWFGKSWGSLVCEHDAHAETPVGDTCVQCDKPIKEDDQGMLIPRGFQDDELPPEVAFHIDCFLDSIKPCPR